MEQRERNQIKSYGIRIEVGGFGLDPVKARVLKGWKRKLKRGLCCFAFPYYYYLSYSLSHYLTRKEREKKKNGIERGEDFTVTIPWDLGLQ